MSSVNTIAALTNTARAAFGEYPSSAYLMGGSANVPMTPAGWSGEVLESMKQSINGALERMGEGTWAEQVADGVGYRGFFLEHKPALLPSELRGIAQAMGEAISAWLDGFKKVTVAETRAGSLPVIAKTESAVFWLSLRRAAIELDSLGARVTFGEKARAFGSGAKEAARDVAEKGGELVGAIADEAGKIGGKFLGGIISGTGLVGVGVLYLGWRFLK